jgi:hypothetical protein
MNRLDTRISEASKKLTELLLLRDEIQDAIHDTNLDIKNLEDEKERRRRLIRENAWQEFDLAAYGCFMIDCGWSLECPNCRVFKGLTSAGRTKYNVSSNRVVADKVLVNVLNGKTAIFMDNKEQVFKGYIEDQRQLNRAVYQTLHKGREW